MKWVNCICEGPRDQAFLKSFIETNYGFFVDTGIKGPMLLKHKIKKIIVWLGHPGKKDIGGCNRLTESNTFNILYTTYQNNCGLYYPNSSPILLILGDTETNDNVRIESLKKNINIAFLSSLRATLKHKATINICLAKIEIENRFLAGIVESTPGFKKYPKNYLNVNIENIKDAKEILEKHLEDNSDLIGAEKCGNHFGKHLNILMASGRSPSFKYFKETLDKLLK